jgi:hypothetical protein
VIGFLRRIRDDRYRRANNRRRTEEIMGWICVPLILFLGWSAFRAWDEVNAARASAAPPEQIIPSTTTIRRN